MVLRLSHDYPAAISWLFARKRMPKPRPGLNPDQAKRIFLEAHRIGKLYGTVERECYETEDQIANGAERVEEVGKNVRDSLEELLGAIRASGHYDVRVKPDPETLAYSLGVVMRLNQSEHRTYLIHSILQLQNALEAANVIAIKTGSVAKQIRHDRQKIGKPWEATLVKEIGYAWCEVIGKRPGRSKQPASTPFGKFLAHFLDDVSGHQIRMGVLQLDQSDVAAIKKNGYIKFRS